MLQIYVTLKSTNVQFSAVQTGPVDQMHQHLYRHLCYRFDSLVNILTKKTVTSSIEAKGL